MTPEHDDLPEWSDEERGLLASAELDRVPREALPRALRAATAAAVATGVAAPAAALTLSGKAGAGLGLVKWLAVVTLVGGAAVGVARWRAARGDQTSETRAALTTATATVTAHVAPLQTPSPALAPSSTATEPEAPAAEPASTVPRHTPTHSTHTEPTAQAQPDLTRDIAALDAARQALRAGRATDALAALDRYDAEFGRSGALRVEARVLRIEATARAGDRTRAETMGRAFLKQNPNSPYAARVRALLPP